MSDQTEAESWYRLLEDPHLNEKDWLAFLEWQAIPGNGEAFDAAAARHERVYHLRRRLLRRG